MPFSQAIRKEALERSHYRCVWCQRGGFLEVHHLEPRSEDGPDTIDNACPLCPNCHELVGSNPQRKAFLTCKRDWWWKHCEKLAISALSVQLSKELYEYLSDIESRRKQDIHEIREFVLKHVEKDRQSEISQARSASELSAAAGIALPPEIESPDSSSSSKQGSNSTSFARNIQSLIRHFLEPHRSKEQCWQIADYLEEIASYANDLATIWVNLFEQYNNGVIDPKVEIDDETLERFDKLSSDHSWRLLFYEAHGWFKPYELTRDIKRMQKLLKGNYMFEQVRVYSALEYFYEELMAVMGREARRKTNTSFLDSLGRLLVYRNNAKKRGDNINHLLVDSVKHMLETFPNIRVHVHSYKKNQDKEYIPDLVFLDDSIRLKDIQSLSRAVLAMQKEAAALHVLAKTYRASI